MEPQLSESLKVSIKEMTSLEAVLLQQYSILFFWLKTSCLSFLIAVAEEEFSLLLWSLESSTETRATFPQVLSTSFMGKRDRAK